MIFASILRIQHGQFLKASAMALGLPVRLGLCASAFAMLLFSSGCEIPSGNAPAVVGPQKLEALTLREGDVVKISIPGAPNLDTVQTIRRDGRVALALIGEVQATGLTPADFQAELVKLYAPQLVSKEVIVSVVSSSFPAFVSGAVLRPGKIVADHPLTALEAIMEAGGPDYTKANLRAVVIIRQEADGKTHNYTLNLKVVIEGKQNEPFYLKPSDIVYVPEGFNLF
jgi:protein involved in polysaccharide export with SLBB domain